MNLYNEVQEAVAAVKERTKIEPQVGVVLGSGLGAFADGLTDVTVIPYGELPHFPTSSVVGHKGELVLGKIEGVSCAVMSGRVHYYEGYEMQRVTFPTRVLAGLGLDKLVITNAAGSINPYYEPGDLMVIVDHLNLTGDNPLRGDNDDRFGPRFPDMSTTYCKSGRQAFHQAANKIGVSLHEGVYAGLAGPSYETPAEIRMLRVCGADAVGMSTVAEVITAGHNGLSVAGLSVITNYAAGLSGKALSHDEVKEVASQVRTVLCDLLAQTVVNFA